MKVKYPGTKYIFIWDDGAEMDYINWIECVKYLMIKFS